MSRALGRIASAMVTVALLAVPAGAVALTAVTALVAASPAGAEPLPIFNPFYAFRAPTAGVPAAGGKSTNWFGYQQNVGDTGGRPFRAVSGDWTVPTVRRHKPGQIEASSDWVGIGGGCVNNRCTTTDTSLIQTGTEQDISATGTPAYYAWFELVPQPATPIGAMRIAPGDHMRATVTQAGPDPNAWTITLQDLTAGQTFSVTVPYVSHRETAEWIEETPLRIGTAAGFAPLPDLSDPGFTGAAANGAPARLVPQERTSLATLGGTVIATASVPAPGGTAFAACAWARTCS